MWLGCRTSVPQPITVFSGPNQLAQQNYWITHQLIRLFQLHQRLKNMFCRTLRGYRVIVHDVCEKKNWISTTPQHPSNEITYVWRVSWTDDMLSASSHTVVVDDSCEFVFVLRLKPFNDVDCGSGLRRLPVADITCQLPFIDENDSFRGRFRAFIGTETGLVLLEIRKKN